MPFNPGRLFGVAGASAPGATGLPTPGGTPDAGMTVADLLNSLEGFQVPEAPQTSKGKKVLGTIGDALTTFANVRSGHAAGEGQFAASQRKQQEDYQDSLRQAEAANADLRDRIRIKDFGERRAAATEESKIKIAKEAAEEQRQFNTEANLRNALINKAVQEDVDLGGRDPLKMTTGELHDAVTKHNPDSGFDAFLSSLPPDMELGEVRQNKDGSVSFSAKRKGSGSGLTAGLLKTFIDSGVDPSGFIKDDPAMAAAAKQAAANNGKQIIAQQADAQLKDIGEAAKVFSFKPDGSPDIVNQATAAAAGDLRSLGQANVNPETVNKYYQGQVDTAAQMLEAGEIAESEAGDYLTRLRQMIAGRFPDVALRVEPIHKKAPEAEKPAAAAASNEPPGGFEKAVTGVFKGLGKGAEGVANIFARPTPEFKPSGGGGAR